MISLVKGGNLSLSKEEPNLTNICIGLGWDPRVTDGVEFDLDASAFLTTGTGKVRSNDDFVFYGQLKSGDRTVEHTGDNRTGQGDGDDESIKVALSLVSPDIQTIVISVSIHDALKRQQNFGMVAGAFIRVVNQDTGREIARYDLTEDFSLEAAVIFGEIYRHDVDWKFRAVGQGYKDGFEALVRNYGVSLGK